MNGHVSKKLRRQAFRVSERLTPELYQRIHDTSQQTTNEEAWQKENPDASTTDWHEYLDNHDDKYSIVGQDAEIEFARYLLNFTLNIETEKDVKS